MREAHETNTRMIPVKKEVAIMGQGYGMMNDGWFGGGVFMLVFWGLAIVGGVYLVSRLMAKH